MKRWSVLLLVVLLAFSLACAALGGGNENNDVDITEEPVEVIEDDEDEPVDEDEIEEEIEEEIDEEVDEAVDEEIDEEVADSPEIEADLSGLDSYRSQLSVSLTGDDFSETLEMIQEATRDPLAQRTLIQSSEGDEMESIEMIQIGDTQWMRFGDSWMQTEATEEQTPFGEDALVSFEDFAEDVDDEDWEFVGGERVNGIATLHYKFEESGLGTAFALGLSEISEANGEVWIADEAGLPAFPVRMVITAEGVDEEGRNVAMEFSSEVTEINTDFVIEAPEDAEMGGMGEDVPRYENAQDVNSLGTILMFSTLDDVSTVSEFYLEELEAAGWTQVEVSELGNMVMQEWQKDERTLSVMISEDEEAGNTGVMLSVETPE